MSINETNIKTDLTKTKMSIERETILTPDFIMGNAIGLFTVLVACVYFDFGFRIVFPFLCVLAILVFIGQQKYLQKMNFDIDLRVIQAQSIYPFINHQILFADLEAIKTRNSISFGQTKYNFIIRRKRKILPLIFEVRTEFEDKEIQKITKKLQEIMPEKML